MTAEIRKFRLGPAAVQQLLPHRRPLLFVDFVAAYERTPRPSLRAGRHISANDETFAGHFPQFPIWPGIYTVEGLNQACNLLASISAIQKHWEQTGGDPRDVLDALREADRSYELKAPLQPGAAARLSKMFDGAGSKIGFSVGIDVRFSAPVFPGSQLDYLVTEVHAEAAAVRYDVEALVDGSPVARGKLTLSQGRSIPSLSAPSPSSN